MWCINWAIHSRVINIYHETARPTRLIIEARGRHSVSCVSYFWDAQTHAEPPRWIEDVEPWSTEWDGEFCLTRASLEQLVVNALQGRAIEIVVPASLFLNHGRQTTWMVHAVRFLIELFIWRFMRRWRSDDIDVLIWHAVGRRGTSCAQSVVIQAAKAVGHWI